VGFSLPGPADLPTLAFSEDRFGSVITTPYSIMGAWKAPLRQDKESARLEGIPQHVVKAGDQEAALKTFLASYPALGDVQSTGPDGRIDWVDDSALDLPVVRVFWDARTPTAGQPTPSLADRVATWYRGELFVFPALGENPKPLHPLLAWWAVLYTLSMLARYEPCAWQKRIDIDGSKEAAAIEHLLEAALDYLPALIRDTISEVS
jgi:hypothetical protein